MSKQPPPAPTASAVGPCPTVIQIVGRPGTGSLPSTFAPPDHPLNKKINTFSDNRIKTLSDNRNWNQNSTSTFSTTPIVNSLYPLRAYSKCADNTVPMCSLV